MGGLLMALAFATGSVNVASTATVGTTFDLVAGFAAKALLLWSTGRSETTDAVGGGNHNTVMGAAISATNRLTKASFSQDAAATSVNTRGQRNTAVWGEVDGAGTPVWTGLLDVNNFTASGGGVQLIVDDQLAATREIFWAIWGGDDITDVALVEFQEPGATGDQDITTLSFRPDAVILGHQRSSTNNATFSTASHHGLGFAIHPDGGSVEQCAVLAMADGGSATMDCDRWGSNTRCLAMNDNGGGDLNGYASYVTSLSNGFRLNWPARAFTAWCFALCFKGGLWSVGEGTTPTSAGSTVTVTTTGSFSPRGGLVLSHGQTESAAAPTAQTGDEWSQGAYTSTTNRLACARLDRDALADAQVATAIEHDEVLVLISSSDTVRDAMDVDAILSNGTRFIMDTADGVADWFGVLQFGDTGRPRMTTPVSWYRATNW